MRQYSRASARMQGFTLIELMIVVVIVAILAAVAYPSYRRYIVKSRRADATISLLKAAQLLERCHTQTGTYDDSDCPINSSGSMDSDDGYYKIQIAAGSTTYTLTAAPTSKGAQSDDTQCQDFTLDELGERGVTGTASNPLETCW